MARPRKFEREDLLEKALEVFWEKGYEATTVQDLGTRMGIHPGSLFNTFGDKRTLFYEALTNYEERVRAMLFGILDQPISRREALTQLFEGTVRFMLAQREAGRRGCFMVNSLMELCPLDPDMDRRATVNLERLENRLFAVVEAAMTGGEIRARSEAELRQLARFLMANILLLRMLARIGSSPEVLQDVAQSALRSLDQ